MGVALFLVMLMALVAVLLVGTRGSLVDVDRFAAVHGLDLTDASRTHAESYLRRARWFRRWGGWLGFSSGWLISAMLDDGTPALTLTTVLVGSLLGMVLAEATWGDPPLAGPRAASLVAREPQRYRSRGTRRVQRFVFGAVAAAALLAVWVEPSSSQVSTAGALVAAGVVVIVAGRWLERRILRRRQPTGDDQLVAVDEQLRAGALESVSAITIGLLLLVATTLALAVSQHQRQYRVEVGGDVVWRSSDVGIPPRLAVREDALVIEWQDRDGDARRAMVPVPPGSGGIRSFQDTKGFLVELITGVFILVGSVWAFGEWLRASRTYYLPTVRVQAAA